MSLIDLDATVCTATDGTESTIKPTLTGSTIPILDHGYVKLISQGTWGSDELIIESARMSTDGSFRGWGTDESPGDERLLKYLWTNKHLSPFEMAGATFEIQAPLFVAREWMRHRTQFYNELSGRYTELPDLYYIPSVERLRAGGQSKSNKQGSGGILEDVEQIRDRIKLATIIARSYYEEFLESGLSRELARLVVPVNQYTRFRASANLRNWLAFLSLRLDSAAQWEIREYASVVGQLLKERFPRTYNLFEGDMN